MVNIVAMARVEPAVAVVAGAGKNVVPLTSNNHSVPNWAVQENAQKQTISWMEDLPPAMASSH